VPKEISEVKVSQERKVQKAHQEYVDLKVTQDQLEKWDIQVDQGQ